MKLGKIGFLAAVVGIVCAVGGALWVMKPAGFLVVGSFLWGLIDWGGRRRF